MSFGELDFSISREAACLVSLGTIVVRIDHTKDGTDYRAQVVKPHPRMGLVTNASYDLQWLVSCLLQKNTDNIRTVLAALPSEGDQISGPAPEASARGKARAGKPSLNFKNVEAGSEAGPSSKTLSFNTPVTPESWTFKRVCDFPSALAYARKNRLGHVVYNGVDNKLPSDSLTIWDLAREREAVTSRMFLIANKLGSAKLVSRINTNRDSLKVNGARNLGEWWDGATSEQKWILLSTSSKRGDLSRVRVGKNRDPYRVLDEVTEKPFSDPHLEVEASSDEEDEGAFTDEDDGEGISII